MKHYACTLCYVKKIFGDGLWQDCYFLKFRCVFMSRHYVFKVNWRTIF